MYDRLLTAREVAERLNISRSYVYYLVSIGELPSIRIRKAVRVPARDPLDEMSKIRDYS